ARAGRPEPRAGAARRRRSGRSDVRASIPRFTGREIQLGGDAARSLRHHAQLGIAAKGELQALTQGREAGAEPAVPGLQPRSRVPDTHDATVTALFHPDVDPAALFA